MSSLAAPVAPSPLPPPPSQPPPPRHLSPAPARQTPARQTRVCGSSAEAEGGGVGRIPVRAIPARAAHSGISPRDVPRFLPAGRIRQPSCRGRPAPPPPRCAFVSSRVPSFYFSKGVYFKSQFEQVFGRAWGYLGRKWTNDSKNVQTAPIKCMEYPPCVTFRSLWRFFYKQDTYLVSPSVGGTGWRPLAKSIFALLPEGFAPPGGFCLHACCCSLPDPAKKSVWSQLACDLPRPEQGLADSVQDARCTILARSAAVLYVREPGVWLCRGAVHPQKAYTPRFSLEPASRVLRVLPSGKLQQTSSRKAGWQAATRIVHCCDMYRSRELCRDLH